MWCSTRICSWSSAFLIYINDIINSSNKLSFILLADDTNLFCSGKDIKTLESIVNEELSHVQEWLMLNQLTLNVKKCNFILFKAHMKQLKTNFSINLNTQEIQKVDKTKFLGIIIDQHLTWKSHIEYIATQNSKATGILCRIRFYVNQPLLKMSYNSLIYPFLHYGNIVWANNYPTRLDKLVKLQKKALRVIAFSLYKAPSRPLFKKLNLLDINQSNDFLVSTMTFSFNLRSKSLPVYFNDFYTEDTRVHNHYTRKSNDLHKKFNRTSLGGPGC